MAVLYLVAAWLIMQVSEVLMTLASLPGWTGQLILTLLAVGFPIALIISWFYELTPEGISLEKDVEPHESITHVTGRRLDFLVISLLCAALILFAYDKWWISGPSVQSIAVLPFANMSDDPNNEYFSDGISEDILNLLAGVPQLRVTSRSSAFSFKGQNLDVPTMAAKLNVAHVLEGSVRKSGNQLRIVAQLIDVESDTHLWSATYDRELENVFAIQDEIAAAVVSALKITLLGKEPRAIETNPEAYALYLQGLHFSTQLSAESSKKAERLLKQALEIDPVYAPAWAELGTVYERQAADFGNRTIDEGNELARDASQKALAIDPQYGLAYVPLARVEMFYDWDFSSSDQHLQQALTLNPGGARILFSAGELNRILGRVDEAVDLMQQSTALDPLYFFGHLWLGDMYYRARRLEEAADSLQTALTLNPDGYAGHNKLGLVLLAQGDAPAALLEIEQETNEGRHLYGMAIVQHAMGDAEASGAALQELIENWGTPWAYQIALVYAFRGEIDEAFGWLEQAYDKRDGGMTHLLLDPLLVNLHDDPRWEPLLDKMGLPH
jgi:TolB-like protein